MDPATVGITLTQTLALLATVAHVSRALAASWGLTAMLLIMDTICYGCLYNY